MALMALNNALHQTTMNADNDRMHFGKILNNIKNIHNPSKLPTLDLHTALPSTVCTSYPLQSTYNLVVPVWYYPHPTVPTTQAPTIAPPIAVLTTEQLFRPYILRTTSGLPKQLTENKPTPEKTPTPDNPCESFAS